MTLTALLCYELGKRQQKMKTNHLPPPLAANFSDLLQAEDRRRQEAARKDRALARRQAPARTEDVRRAIAAGSLRMSIFSHFF